MELDPNYEDVAVFDEDFLGKRDYWPHVVCFGNAFGGLELVGPFDSYYEARTWASVAIDWADDWTLVAIEPEDEAVNRNAAKEKNND